MPSLMAVPARILALALFCCSLPLQAASPQWSLQNAAGETVEFPAAAAGKPSVLLFWATWCPYCQALMPHVQKVHEDYADQGVKVYAVNVLENDDSAAYMRRHGLTYPLLLKGDAIMADYGVRGTPWLLVLDGQQQVLFKRVPGMPPAAVEARIREALDAALK